MKRAILVILFLTVIPFLPTLSSANLTVQITAEDLGGTNPQSLLSLSCATDTCTTVSGVTTLNLIQTCSAGTACTLYLPSGGSSPAATDLFIVQDVSPSLRARVIMTNGASVDKLELKGAIFTSLVVNKKLKLVAQTGLGDLGSIGTGNYLFTANMSGTFTKPASAGGGRASLCPAPAITFPAPLPAGTVPCVELRLTANVTGTDNTVNTAGGEGVATVSVPPDPQTTSCSVTQADGTASGGTYGSSGSFCSTDSEKIAVSGTASPTLRAQYTARFGGAQERLSFPGSGFAGASSVTVENEAIFYMSAECPDCGLNNNVYSFNTASAEDFLFFCDGASCGKTFTKSGASGETAAIPIQVSGKKATSYIEDSISLVAIESGDPAFGNLPQADQDLWSRAFLIFLTNLKLRDITTLTFNHSLADPGLYLETGSFSSKYLPGTATLGDCAGGSFFVLLRVLDGSTPGQIAIDLGTNPTTGSNAFQTNCQSGGLHTDTNLAANSDARVRVNGTPGFTFASAVQQFGPGTVVQSISLVVQALDNGSGSPPNNQQAKVYKATIGTKKGACKNPKCVFTAQKAQTFEDFCALPTSGRRIAIRKISPTVSDQQFIQDADIINLTCGYKGTFKPAGELNPVPGDNLYKVEVEFSGSIKPTKMIQNGQEVDATFTITGKP